VAVPEKLKLTVGRRALAAKAYQRATLVPSLAVLVVPIWFQTFPLSSVVVVAVTALLHTISPTSKSPIAGAPAKATVIGFPDSDVGLKWCASVPAWNVQDIKPL
jgi:hypothetical protein